MTDANCKSPHVGKRLVRSSVIGALVGSVVISGLLVLTAGLDGMMPTKAEYQAVFPDHDYTRYVVNSILNLLPSAALAGAVVGALISVARWAFSK
ncbi:hypothetical protein [Antarctobacter sp.]|uniref:hypothetical protein n=1 Tax=Antarctobacter sp. TaxID=1872577 RepID=UPI002B26ECC7|nr:hypothetical protein [Antarctobacter sp.]